MIYNKLIDKRTTLCNTVSCLLALSLEVSIASPDLLVPRQSQFCLLHIQVASFQAIADSPPQRPSHNPLPINHFRTLFIATEGMPLPPPALQRVHSDVGCH